MTETAIHNAPSPQPGSRAGIGATLHAAHEMMERIGVERMVTLWFDWQANVPAVSLNEGFHDSIAAQRGAFEAACRLLTLRIKAPPPPFTFTSHDAKPGACNGSEMARIFELFHARNAWGARETVSGPGSTIHETEPLRAALRGLLNRLRIKSLLDAPCGDCHWIRQVPMAADVHYVGVDIVEALVQRNRQAFRSERAHFACRDLLIDPLPAVDLVLCRDCLVHLTHRDARQVLENLCRTRSQWLLTTTYPGRRAAADVPTGHWRPLNLELAPYSLPPPQTLLVERCTEGNGFCTDKCLGLWHLRDVAEALGVSG